MTCTECESIQKRKNIIYEDSLVVAMLTDKPVTAGHITLLPREHQTIFEKVPDATVGHMFSIANKLAMVCFETLGAHGTNILIRNGVEGNQKSNHTMIDIIPRADNDNINFQWSNIKVTEDELNTMQLMLKDQVGRPMGEEKKEEVKEEAKEEKIMSDEEENYLLKQLERIP